MTMNLIVKIMLGMKVVKLFKTQRCQIASDEFHNVLILVVKICDATDGHVSAQITVVVVLGSVRKAVMITGGYTEIANVLGKVKAWNFAYSAQHVVRVRRRGGEPVCFLIGSGRLPHQVANSPGFILCHVVFLLARRACMLFLVHTYFDIHRLTDSC